jgi:hypothetical protein
MEMIAYAYSSRDDMSDFPEPLHVPPRDFSSFGFITPVKAWIEGIYSYKAKSDLALATLRK